MRLTSIFTVFIISSVCFWMKKKKDVIANLKAFNFITNISKAKSSFKVKNVHETQNIA